MSAFAEVAQRVIDRGFTLDEFLHGTDDTPPEHPESLEQVDALLGRLRRVRARRDADRALAKARAEQIGEWLAEREQDYEGTERYILSLLQSWHVHLLSLDDKAKSVSLPNGVLKSRASAARIEVVDEADFVGWCEVHRPDLLRERVTHTPDRKALNEALRAAETDTIAGGLIVVDPATGELVPGVAHKPAGRTFTVETTEELG